MPLRQARRFSTHREDARTDQQMPHTRRKEAVYEMRARMKLIEDIDPAYLCCRQVADNTRRFEGLVVELVTEAVEQTWNCWCDKGTHTCMNYLALVPGVDQPVWCAVGAMDVEEGS